MINQLNFYIHTHETNISAYHEKEQLPELYINFTIARGSTKPTRTYSALQCAIQSKLFEQYSRYSCKNRKAS